MGAIKMDPVYEELDLSISRSGCDVEMIDLVRIAGHKVRLSIRSNAYKFQSHARAFVWSPGDLEWRQIAEIPYGDMVTPEGLYVLPQEHWNADEHFAADRDRLIALTRKILD